MKKLSILAFAMGLMAFTACSEKKAPAPAPVQAEQTVVTDSAFQAAAAGEYKSADGERSVTLNSDFSVKVKGLDKEFYKWELPAKPEGKAAVIILSRKGLDADVQEQATLDTEEGSIIIKNETFRKK
ncbi:hypothetical protein I6E75_09455 [Prevotella copri]|jgi:hypothetical protein|uniref:hypothetical protein n=1 Tax=Segatella copri TaxID=165179 RepID=UPI001F3FC510|nr:hypothetical protein [Segatella copri]MCF2610462.1 hypothetical protein [Segatella copri]